MIATYLRRRRAVEQLVEVAGVHLAAGRPPPAPCAVLSLASCTLGWSNGLMPSTQPGHRHGELGEEEDAAEVGGAVHGERERRVAGAGQRLHLRVDAPRRRRRGRAGRRTRGRRRRTPGSPSGSPATGRMPLPCLPVDSAISCSTQSPKLSIGSATTKVSLVAALARQLAHRDAEPEPGVGRSSSRSAAQFCSATWARCEQRLDVHARQRGRHQPEVGQHRVAPADVGVVLEHVPEAALARQVHQRAAGVGDGDEAAARRRPCARRSSACARASRSSRRTSTTR